MITEIPIFPSANFAVRLTLEGFPVVLRFRWNLTLKQWFMDVETPGGALKTLFGVPVVEGRFILASHAVTEIGGLVVLDDTGQGAPIAFEEFGGRWKLYYVPPELMRGLE